MTDKKNKGQDIAGMRAILQQVAASNKNKNKDIPAQETDNREWEKDRSSTPEVNTTGNKDHSYLPLLRTTPQEPKREKTQTLIPPKQIELTEKQRILFNWLKYNPDVITQYDEISEITGIKRETIRKALSRFVKLGWVEKYRANRSEVQGIRIICNVSGMEEWERGLVNTSGKNSPLRLDNRKTLSYSQSSEIQSLYNRLLDLTEEDIKEQFPFLHEIQFGISEIKRLVDHWRKFDIEAKGIFQSLKYADWAVEHGATDKEGKRIGAGYVFNALKRNGGYDRPKDYESPAEKAAREEQELLKLKEEERLNQEEHEFNKWLESLSDEEKSEIDEQHENSRFKVPIITFYKQVWKQRIGINTTEKVEDP
jgi:DNA-binding Lrp family transcriptional regulator